MGVSKEFKIFEHDRKKQKLKICPWTIIIIIIIIIIILLLL